MKSIQTKIIVLIMMVVMLCSIVIGGIGVLHLESLSDQNSAQIMNLSCREEGKKLGQTFHSIEQSVKIIAQNSISKQGMEKVLKSDTLRGILIEDLRPIVLASAKSTDGAVAVYVHFNPEIAPADSGIFYSKTLVKESFYEQPVTDLSKVRPEEMDTMDWYYKPVEVGEAVWLEPYYNGKIEELVISYVVPIYQDELLIGIAGMDVLFSDIVNKVADVAVFNTGIAYLVNDKNEIMYHPNGETVFPVTDVQSWQQFVTESKEDIEGKYIYEYQDGNEKYKLACYELDNNMRLLLSAATDEIDAEKNELVRDVFISVIMIALIGILTSVIISQSIIRPLKELTKVSKKIADGNLKIKIPSGSKDEVGELADSLQQTVDCLRVYMDRISDLAYTDTLTGVKSKTAYDEEVRRLNENIAEGFHQFGIIMFDMNGLKEMNDTYGHDAGDAYIKNSCRLICTTYKHSPVFRIGGDEFIAVLRGQDLLNSQKLMCRFYERMQKIVEEAKKPEEAVSVAAGMAVFKEHKDTDVQSVFKRADENMYKNKTAIKAGKTPDLNVEQLEI
ncbi:MAG: diguanylate cyclase [Lachnospiraceae bacterium]|nr:diguanylate cyclase [Lachnospiraceae bacterium]